MALAPIDYVLFVVYLAGVLFLGVWLTRGVESSEDYFLAGRRLPFWAIGMSIVVSDIGASDMIGLGGVGFRYGIAAAHWDWIGSFCAMVVAAFVFVPFFWRTGVYTIPEFLGRRYNQAVRSLHGGLWVVILCFDIGVLFHASALLVETLLGWDYDVTIWGLAAFIGVYMIGAGLTAVVVTDVVQLVVMLIGGLAVVVLGVWKAGGPLELVERVRAIGPETAQHFELYLPPDGSTPFPWTGILFGLGFVMSTAYFSGNQTIVQRTLAARTEWDAKASMLLAAGFKALIPVLVVTPGLVALALYGAEIDDPDTAYPTLIKHLLPPGMTGLMFAAFLAAMMSSIDSLLNATATLFTIDFYQRMLRPRASERELVWTGRVATLTVLLLGALTARTSERFTGLYAFMQTLLSISAGPTLAILVLGTAWKRCSQWGGFWGLLLGGTSALVMHLEPVASRLFSIEDPFLYISVWSFVLAVLVTVAVSLVTRPWPEQRIAPLLWSSVRKKAPERA